MKTVEDLGKKIKAEHPGVYDDMSDVELGRKVKAAYPEYSDYQDLALTPTTPDPLAPLPDGLPYTEQAIEAIKAHYHPSRGRFTSWWQRGKAEGRNKLLEALNEEQLRVIQHGAILEQEAIKSRQGFVTYQTFLVQNAALIHGLRAMEHLINQALERGFTVETDQEVRKQTEFSRIKVEEHQRLKDLDLQARWREIQQDSDAADLAQLGDYLLVKKLRQELREAREERHRIKKDDIDEELKAELVADYDEFISRLKAKIDERETGHIPSQNGKEKAGAKGTSNSRANYPPESDED